MASYAGQSSVVAAGIDIALAVASVGICAFVVLSGLAVLMVGRSKRRMMKLEQSYSARTARVAGSDPFG